MYASDSALPSSDCLASRLRGERAPILAAAERTNRRSGREEERLAQLFDCVIALLDTPSDVEGTCELISADARPEEVVQELSLLRRAIGTHLSHLGDEERAQVDAAIDRVIVFAVSEARRAQERSAAIIDALLQSSPVGMALLDRELRYRRVNPVLAEANGRSAESHVGRTISEVLGPAAQQIEEICRQVIRTGQPVNGLRVDGERVPLNLPPRYWNLSFFPVREQDGTTVGLGAAVVDVTERERAAEEGERLLAELRAVIDQAPVGIFVAEAASGRVFLRNRLAAKLMGEQVVDARGRTVPERGDALHADDSPYRPEEYPLVRVLRGEGEVRAHDLRYRMPDGEVRVLEASATAVRNGRGEIIAGLLLLADVTAERQAREHQRFLDEASLILGSSLDYQATLGRLARLAVPRLADWCVVDAVDGDGNVVRLAAEHTDPTRRRLALSIGVTRGVRRVLQSRQATLASDLDDRSLREAAETEEHYRVLKALKLRSWMIVPLVARGELLGAIGLGTAESGRRLTEQDLELTRELARRAAFAIDNARLYERSAEAVRARDELLTMASHELRTPLTALLLQLHSAGRAADRAPEAVSQRLHERLSTAEHQVQRLNELVTELLDTSRAQSGQLELLPERTDLGAVVRAVEERFRHESEANATPIRVRLDDGAVGRWDEARLEQVVANLVSNALKYGRGWPVEVVVSRDGERARLQVRDHGIGIEEADQERIFEPFERARGGRPHAGLGLGLYMVRRIVEAHGGRVWVESTSGDGATFTVELPLAGPPAEEPRASAPPM